MLLDAGSLRVAFDCPAAAAEAAGVLAADVAAACLRLSFCLSSSDWELAGSELGKEPNAASRDASPSFTGGFELDASREARAASFP